MKMEWVKELVASTNYCLKGWLLGLTSIFIKSTDYSDSQGVNLGSQLFMEIVIYFLGDNVFGDPQ